MKEIWADFNARMEDDRVSLKGCGSLKSLQETGAVAGEWVWLSDGELKVRALLELTTSGHLVARPVWEEIVDIDTSLR